MIPIECESRVERVVVYARGAVVTRRVALPADLPEGPVDLRVPGVTALAEAGSLRAIAEGSREVTALRPRLAVPSAPARPGRLLEEARAIRFEKQRLEAERAHLGWRRAELGARAPEPLFTRWARSSDPAGLFGDALALSDLLGAEIELLDGRARDLEEAIADAQRRAEAAEIALAQGSSAEVLGEDQARLSVLIRLGEAATSGASDARDALAIEYVVAAARFWPAYTARFTAQATRVKFTLDAFIAQASGEDWTRARIAVSTADLAQDARLPELRALRMGRAQPAPRRGYRPPPAGLEAMFEGYDQALSRLAVPRRAPTAIPASARMSPPPPPPPPRRSAVAPAGPAAPGSAPPAPASYSAMPAALMPPQQEMARLARPAAGGGGAPSMPMPQPTPKMAKRRMEEESVTRSGSVTALGGMRRSDEGALFEETADSLLEDGPGAAAPMQEAAIEPGDAWLDFDALTLPDPSERARRGRLCRSEGGGAGGRIASARAAIDALAAPTRARDPLETRGRFDHRYDAEGTADVPSSGRPHRIALASAEAPAKPRFITVPREVAEVYREVEIQNPFDAPLLAGPVEVFIDGALLTTSSVGLVDKSGLMYLGLGVEDRIRVARNVRVSEGTAGLLGGSTTVEHAITIDVTSSLGQKVSVDVLDRVPVTDDKDIDVKLLSAKPEPEKYTQADRGSPVRRGLRFRVEVPPGDKQRIELAYRVTLPAKNELVGGNRRD